MKVICKKYPQLYIADLGILFVNGEAEVADADKYEKIAGMRGYDFEYEGDPSENTPPPKSTYDELRAEAALLGLTFPGNIRKADLDELIARAKGGGGGAGAGA